MQKLQRNGFALNYIHPATYEISSYTISNLGNFQKVLKRRNNIFQTHVECSLAATIAKRDEGAGRLLLGDNTGGRAIMQWPFSFDSVTVWVSTGLTGVYACLTIFILNSDLCRAFRNATLQ
jgi:hypothetical protein